MLTQGCGGTSELKPEFRNRTVPREVLIMEWFKSRKGCTFSMIPSMASCGYREYWAASISLEQIRDPQRETWLLPEIALRPSPCRE